MNSLTLFVFNYLSLMKSSLKTTTRQRNHLEILGQFSLRLRQFVPLFTLMRNRIGLQTKTKKMFGSTR